MVHIEWAPNAEKYKFITQEGVYDGSACIYYEEDEDIDDWTSYCKNNHALMLELRHISMHSQVGMPVRVYTSSCTTLPSNLIFWK